MEQLKFIFIVLIFIFIGGCTTGKLYYTDKSDKRNLGCDVAFTGLLSVDKYAVEYALSLCAKNYENAPLTSVHRTATSRHVFLGAKLIPRIITPK